jgi:UDP-N-acetylmuramoyl-L-alanyl-D-glutamate--2,6-diaminopimelate ligase
VIRVVIAEDQQMVLGALAALLVSGVPLAEGVRALAAVAAVPGRMQRLGGGREPLVVIDYAHTPDALQKVLEALRGLTGRGRLICVFGCGGERDRGKRPLMGELAARLADRAIVTSDNPRGEDPQAIIAEIAEGMNGDFTTEQDRARAIRLAVSEARAGDVLLLAGKGHETYQEIAGRRTPFSDLEVARNALRANLRGRK